MPWRPIKIQSKAVTSNSPDHELAASLKSHVGLQPFRTLTPPTVIVCPVDRLTNYFHMTPDAADRPGIAGARGLQSKQVLRSSLRWIQESERGIPRLHNTDPRTIRGLQGPSNSLGSPNSHSRRVCMPIFRPTLLGRLAGLDHVLGSLRSIAHRRNPFVTRRQST